VAIHPQVRVVVRPYGSPVPLGFLAFGIGMFLYAALNAPWVKAADAQTIGLLLAGFVAPLELVATVFAFLARDTVAAATLGLFAGSWFVAGLTTLQSQPGELNAATGYFLIAFTIVVVLLGVAAFYGKPFIGLLLVVSAFRGLFSAIYELGGGKCGTRSAAGCRWSSSASPCTAGSPSCSRTCSDGTCCPSAGSVARGRRWRAT